MRYHADPLYGCWTPRTAVVSIGAARRFVFREVDDHGKRWHYVVQNGDVVYMYGDCQERLQHSVIVEKQTTWVQQGRGRGGDGSDSTAQLAAAGGAAAVVVGPRMSLVFKERIPGTL